MDIIAYHGINWGLNETRERNFLEDLLDSVNGNLPVNDVEGSAG